MKALVVVWTGVVVGVGFVSGCTHREPLADVRTLAWTPVRVETAPGYEEEGEVVPSESGGVVVRTGRGDFTLDEVDTITDVVRWRGALEGFGLGLVIGGGTGALLGYAGGDTPQGFAKSAGENAVVTGVVMGAMGSLVGLVVGIVRGSRDVYSGGSPAAQTRVIPVGPSSSTVGATVRF